MVQPVLFVFCVLGCLACLFSIDFVKKDRALARAEGLNGDYEREARRTLRDQWVGFLGCVALAAIFLWATFDPSAGSADPSTGMIGRGLLFLVVVGADVGRSLYAAWCHHTYVYAALKHKPIGGDGE